VIAGVARFGLVWFGTASLNEAWRMVASAVAIGLAVGLATKLVEALVNRKRADAGRSLKPGLRLVDNRRVG
jgi:hypothetical protein